jgi:hypothetical protein
MLCFYKLINLLGVYNYSSQLLLRLLYESYIYLDFLLHRPAIHYNSFRKAGLFSFLLLERISIVLPFLVRIAFVFLRAFFDNIFYYSLFAPFPTILHSFYIPRPLAPYANEQRFLLHQL